MKTINNTILVTGGSAGIGFEMAKSLSEAGNRVIITGRTKDRLDGALARLNNVTGIVSDITKAEDVDSLVAQLTKDFPQLNVVINNAGNAYVYNMVQPGANGFDKAGDEMLTNYLSIIRLNEHLLPLLKQQAEAAIVNVSSIVAYAPNVKLITYGASKAALHAYTQALRIALEDTNVKVFELMPPLVDTEFSTEIGGATNGIPAHVVADDLLSALGNNEYEIRVGRTAEFYNNFFASSANAVLAMNGKL
jgi:uncharacterized oxidoreductase